ncbi:MAG TPA: metabolite traffic protein EboE [Alphaproteobacteria bacterium]|nr:metabolite traffic protein EboE [Alphaproteobacteria bacterium]
MELNHGAHLAYCTNVHHGQNWPETLDSLQKYTLAVRSRVCPGRRFAIGLRLSSRAATELADGQTLLEFQRWMEKNDCYIFTINGFPYGRFHGGPVKEKVYLPDWTSADRLDYTNLLFDLLVRLLPDGVAGSVSTLPGGFKEFVQTEEQVKSIRQNLWRCVEHASRLSEQTGKQLHLGLEPEPLCLLENSTETISFMAKMRDEHKNDPRLNEYLGVNYDCCHFAVEFEEPQNALPAFEKAGVRISKVHLSSALKTTATPDAPAALKKFSDDVYLHQVIVRDPDGQIQFFRDLPDALKDLPENILGIKSPADKHGRTSGPTGRSALPGSIGTMNRAGKMPAPPKGSREENSGFPEWRIHFHVPLHAPAILPFQNTSDHLSGVLDWLEKNPKACSHLEMETYTWEVLPPELKSRTVVEQLAAEYDWTLAELAKRGLA